MAPAYTAGDVEPSIYQRWLDADVFAPDGTGDAADRSSAPFVITSRRRTSPARCTSATR